jgi:AraC-like DNA-binding protein
MATGRSGYTDFMNGVRHNSPGGASLARTRNAVGRANLRLAGASPRSVHAEREEEPLASSLARLATRLAAHAPYDGAFPLRLPSLYVVRRSRLTRTLERATVRPSLCIVAQGAKTVMLGRDVYPYDASCLVAYAVDLPLAGQVIRASQREPFLVLVLKLDPYKIAELTLKVYPHGVPTPQESRGVIVGQTTTAIVDAATRLVESMAHPAEAELLAPLAVDEILTRLLLSPIGPRVAQIGQHESSVQRVAKAVGWVREHFDQPLALDDLAELVNMSVSSFHQHFKAVTAMTPLQYQKVLRLQEARRLMLSRMLDAGSAARQVGYLSPSQFSREYTRLFGNSPTRDIATLRRDGTQWHAEAR